jgi:Arc/MetJ-type ribon-helix-helix transcriptional regulator
MDRLEIALSEDLRAHVDARIASGTFGDAGAYIEALIARDRQDLEALRTAIDQADNSGISPRTPRQVLDDALRRHIAG